MTRSSSRLAAAPTIPKKKRRRQRQDMQMLNGSLIPAATRNVTDSGRARQAAPTRRLNYAASLWPWRSPNGFPSLTAASFDPGFLPETNLAREFPSAAAAIVKRIIPYTMPRDRTGTVATTAPAYASLILGAMSLSASGAYLAMRDGKAIEIAPSKLAQTPSIGEALWEESLRLLK